MAKSDVWTLNFNNAAQSTRQSPIVTPAAGITSFEVALTRASLNPAIVLAWSIEVSRDGGAHWLPWGGAGTVGGIALDAAGTPSAESNFVVFLDAAADAATRVRATLTNTGARMTTTITIRSDTTAIPLRAMPAEHHSVIYDNFKEVRNASAVTSLTTPSFDIVNDASSVAVLLWITGTSNGASAWTSTCGGVTGAAIANATANQASFISLIHGVTHPGSGSQTASMSWVTANNVSLGVMTAWKVNQSTPFTNGAGAGASSTTPSVTVATAVGDLTVACGSTAQSFASPTQTQLWLDTTVTGGGGSRGPGTGTSDVHAWTQSTGHWSMAGANLVAAAVATPAPTQDFSRYPKFLLRPRPRAESV